MSGLEFTRSPDELVDVQHVVDAPMRDLSIQVLQLLGGVVGDHAEFHVGERRGSGDHVEGVLGKERGSEYDEHVIRRQVSGESSGKRKARSRLKVLPTLPTGKMRGTMAG